MFQMQKMIQIYLILQIPQSRPSTSVRSRNNCEPRPGCSADPDSESYRDGEVNVNTIRPTDVWTGVEPPESVDLPIDFTVRTELRPQTSIESTEPPFFSTFF